MGYAANYSAAAADSSTLRKQIAWAVTRAASDIRNEDPGTANHLNRLDWAKRITRTTNGIDAEAERVAWGVMQNATIQAAVAANPESVTDNDVQFVVNSLINEYAGE